MLLAFTIILIDYSFSNRSSFDMDMTGCKFVSVIENYEYYFPEGYILKSGASVKINSGPSAADDGIGILKRTTASIWNNSGDPGRLYDSNNKPIHEK